MSAVKDGMLFILDIIICLTKVAVWGRPVIPSSCLKAKGVNTESKSSHAANDIMGEVKEHVFGETVRRMHDQGPVCRRSAPLVIGQPFTIAQSVGKVVFLDELFDSGSTSCKWSQSCISCNIQVESFVAHHAQIFEGACVGQQRPLGPSELTDP